MLNILYRLLASPLETWHKTLGAESDIQREAQRRNIEQRIGELEYLTEQSEKKPSIQLQRELASLRDKLQNEFSNPATPTIKSKNRKYRTMDDYEIER